MASALIPAQAQSRAELESLLRCPIAQRVATDPIVLACGHTYNRYHLVNYAAVQMRAIWDAHFRLDHPTCPICHRRIVVLYPEQEGRQAETSALEAYKREFGGEFREAQWENAQDAKDQPEENPESSQTIVTTAPFTEQLRLIQDFMDPGIRFRVLDKIFPTFASFNSEESPTLHLRSSQIQFCPKGTPIRISFDVQACDHVYSLTWDRDKNLELTSMRPATWGEKWDYYNAYPETLAGRTKQYLKTAAKAAAWGAATAVVSYFTGTAIGAAALTTFLGVTLDQTYKYINRRREEEVFPPDAIDVDDAVEFAADELGLE